eukprot:14819589-Alexandrium_andersonii.AAC.1
MNPRRPREVLRPPPMAEVRQAPRRPSRPEQQELPLPPMAEVSHRQYTVLSQSSLGLQPPP